MTSKNLALVALATFGLSLAFASPADARPGRVSQAPNGAMFSCGLCHADGGAGPRNAFGQDVEATLTEPGAAGVVQWDQIFNLDSDGDGCTNGQELGDPDGAWAIGDPDPDGTVTSPGDEGSTQECGDAPNNAPNNDGNNAPNNDGNNDGNNDAPNNDAPNNDTGDGGDDGSDDGGDDGCTTAPGQNSTGGVLLLLLGLVGLRLRRDA